MSDKTYLRTILKNIQFNFIRNMLISMLAFIASIVYARFLGPDLYGTYTYVIWLINTLAIMIALGIPGTITRYVPDYYYNKKHEQMYLFHKKINLFFLYWGILITVVIALTVPLWNDNTNLAYDNKVGLLLISTIIILPTMLNLVNTSFIQAVRGFKYYAKVNVSGQLMMIIGNIAIVLTIKNVILMVISLGLFNLIQAILYTRYIMRLIPYNGYVETGLKDKKNIIKYSRTMYINVIWQQIVWARSEFFFLGIYSGSKSIAIYGLAYSLMSTVSMVFAPIMNVLVNNFSELVSKKENILLNKLIFYTTKYFGLILIPTFCIIIIFYKPLLLLVYSKEYIGVIEIFPILMFSTLFSIILSVGNSLPFYHNKQNYIVSLGILIGIVNIILDVMFIPNFGYLGAAIANVSSQILFTIIAVVYNIRLFNTRYPIKFLIASTLLSVCLFVPYIYINNTVITIVGLLASLVIYIIVLNMFKMFDSTDKENFKKCINFLKKILMR